MRYVVLGVFLTCGSLVALEANMFQQQTWNVQQQKDAKKKWASPTMTFTPNPKAPTATITQTPDPSKLTPTPTPTPTPGK
jgi:hypothetical protein